MEGHVAGGGVAEIAGVGRQYGGTASGYPMYIGKLPKLSRPLVYMTTL